MDGLNIDGVKFTGYTNSTSKSSKSESSTPLFNVKGADNSGFYPSLNFSPEARMAAEMDKSPFMQGLNELFGIS